LPTTGIDPEVLDGFLDAEEVASHNLTGTLLAGRGFKAAVLNQPDHFRGKVVALRVDDFLGKFIREPRLLHLEEKFVLTVHRDGAFVCLAYHVWHGTPPFIT